MVLLVHETRAKSALGILKDKALRPSCETKNARYFEEDDCFDYVFLSVLHPFQTFKTAHADVILFFKPDVLKKYNTKHWSRGWNWGEFEEGESIKYNRRKSPEANIQIWSENYKQHITKKNELVFSPGGMGTDEVVIEDTIPLEDNLVAVYLDKMGIKYAEKHGIELPTQYKYITTRPALTKFLKEHGYA